MTPADVITISRTFLVLLLAVLIYYGIGSPYLVSAALVLAFLLDAIDGIVARKYRCSTVLGSLLDVVGDRITEIILWLTFLSLDLVPLWAPVSVLSRAVITDALRAKAASKNVSVYSMSRSRIFRAFVSSRWSRGLYGTSKAVFFVTLTLMRYGVVPFSSPLVTAFSLYLVAYSLVRGLPVLLSARNVM